MRVIGWHSVTGEILVATDADTAREIVRDITTQEDVGAATPALRQVRDQMRAALLESPVAGVGP